LIDYMSKFLLRVKPLTDLEQELQNAKKHFDTQWLDGTFPGWALDDAVTTTGGANPSAMSRTGAYLDLSAFGAAEELTALGLDRLKSALMALDLKCGGTLQERAQRLFNTKGKRMEDIDKSLFTKNPNQQQLSDKEKITSKKELEKRKELANLEANVYHFVELLSEQRAATKENVERRQARGLNEDEEDEEAPAPPSDDDDEDDVPYNPKNLPLGWDGKPIPYWLYKLHGLNISYPCEICGNQIYKGPKAFQRHFSEWRHAHGMRCLGIPNTAHFANIVKISDALDLWIRLREQKEVERFKPEVEEEYEDTHGNVVNKKTYEDLLRQGLL